MNKGFFSVAIIIFIFLISIFFFTLNSQKEIYFSDDFRHMIFDSEQAYVLAYKDFVANDCSFNKDYSKEYGSCTIDYNTLVQLLLNVEKEFIQNLLILVSLHMLIENV